MNYIVHKEVQKVVKLPNQKPIIEELGMSQTYDGNKANISVHMRKNNKHKDLNLSLNNDEIIQLIKNRPSIDEMLHKRLTHDFSSILNGHLEAQKQPPQLPLMQLSVVGLGSKSKTSGRGRGRGITKRRGSAKSSVTRRKRIAKTKKSKSNRVKSHRSKK